MTVVLINYILHLFTHPAVTRPEPAATGSYQPSIYIYKYFYLVVVCKNDYYCQRLKHILMYNSIMLLPVQ